MFHIVFTKALFTILLGVSVVSQAYAGDCAVYAAFLSDNDRHNSSGDPLNPSLTFYAKTAPTTTRGEVIARTRMIEASSPLSRAAQNFQTTELFWKTSRTPTLSRADME